MAYTIKGTLVLSCNCHDFCPCPGDLRPNGPDGECKFSGVFGIRDGDADGVDLSGVNFVLYVNFASKPSAGNWRVGLLVDEGASDEQAGAIERIIKGEAGGPWEDLAALRSEWLGVERAAVSVTDGEALSAEVAGKGKFSFEPFRDSEGTGMKVSNAPFPLVPVYTPGQASGSSDAFGISFDASYGETGEFEYAS